MAIGTVGAEIEAADLTLGATPDNDPGMNLFKVAANIYILWYHAGVALRAATFSINDADGNIDPTIIEDVVVVASHLDDSFQYVGQISGTVFVVSQVNTATNMRLVTWACNTDGTNIRGLQTENVTVPAASAVSSVMLKIAPDVVVVMPNAGARIVTYAISDAGVISSPAIQAQVGTTQTRSAAWVRDAYLVQVGSSGNVQTIALNPDGTFSTTIIDSITLPSTISTSPPSIVALDQANGICAVASVEQITGSLNDLNIHRVTVDASGMITAALHFNAKKLNINFGRPTVHHIGNGVFLWFVGGGTTIQSTGSDFVDIDNGVVTTATKNCFFVLVSPTIGAMACNTTVSGTGITIVTFPLESPGGNSVGISAQVGMQQRELLLF